MQQPMPPTNAHVPPKEPSFLAAVALASVALFLIFAFSVLFVDVAGTKLLPRIHKLDTEPTSCLVMPTHGVGGFSGVKES